MNSKPSYRLAAVLLRFLLVLFAALCSVPSAVAARHAFVANSVGNTVSVISLDTQAVVATIPVGTSPRFLVASPDGGRVYVSNYSSNSVSVIDTASLTVVATIPVGSNPTRLAAHRNGQRIYVTNSGSASISVIDRQTNAVSSTIATTPSPYTIAFHPVRDEFWVGYNTTGTVLRVYSAIDHSVLAFVSSGSRAYASTGLVFKADGSEAFASESCGACGRFHRFSGTPAGGTVSLLQSDILYDNTGSANGTAYNPATGIAYLAKQGQFGTPRLYEFGGLARSLSFTDPPLELAMTSDATRLYVVNDKAAGTVSVVDLQTFTRIAVINVGANPFGIVIIEDSPKAYVANTASNSVSVISLKTRSVVGTVGVGTTPRFLAATPDGKRVYVSNLNSNNVSVIDTGSLTVVATIPVGTAPARLAVSRNGQRIYVANSGSASISVIDRATNTVSTTIATTTSPYAIAYHPFRDEFWVGYNTTGTVLRVYSANDHSVLAFLSSGSRAYASTGLVFKSDGSEAFGSEGCGACGRFHRISGNHSGGTISVLQQDILYDNTGHANGAAYIPATGIAYLAKQGQFGTPTLHEFGGLNRSLTFIDPPTEIALASDGAQLYVVNDKTAGTVSVVDTQTMTKLTTIDVGNNPLGIIVVEDAPNVFVANSADNTVSAISLKTLAVIGTIAVGNNPRFLVVTPDGKRLYVSNYQANTVSVIDTTSLAVVGTVNVGINPTRLAVSPDGQRIFVTNTGGSSISVINRQTNTVATTIATTANPNAIAFHPARNEFWVGYNTTGTVLRAYSAVDYSVLAFVSSFSRAYASTGIVFSPDGSEVFTSEGCGACGRFHRFSGTISGGAINLIQPDLYYDNTGHANGIAFNPVSGVVYLAKQGQFGTPTLHEFGGPARYLTFTDPPTELACTADGTLLYAVNNTNAGMVSVVDTRTLAEVAKVSVGANPLGIAMAPSSLLSSFSASYPGLNPGGDANSNGQVNYLDYAAGVDPTGAPDASARTHLFTQGGITFWQYTRRTNVADIYTDFEKSTDLVTWSPMQLGTDYLVESTDILAPNRKQVLLRLLLPFGAPGQFWRQKVSTAP